MPDNLHVHLRVIYIFIHYHFACILTKPNPSQPEKTFLHRRPLHRERTNALLLRRHRVLAANHVRLLRPRTETSTAYDIQQVELLVPAQACGQEVAVVPQRVAGVDRVVAAEAQPGHEEVAARVQEAEERVALGDHR